MEKELGKSDLKESINALFAKTQQADSTVEPIVSLKYDTDQIEIAAQNMFSAYFNYKIYKCS